MLQKLGLNQEVIDFTMESLEDSQNHQCDMYFVQRSMEEVVQSSFHKSCSSILESCFEKVFSKELELCLKKNNLLNHQGLEYWMCLYIEYVNDQVNNIPRFQNNGGTTGQWFSSSASTNNENYNITCINIDSDGLKAFPHRDGTFPLSTKDSMYWYHGTTQTNAECIRNKGIILEKGRQKQDFSNTGGFYVNPKFEDAAEWASKRFKITTGAILIYQFPLEGFRGLNLFNQETEGKWEMVVAYYRSGCENLIPDDVEKELDEVDYIIGPMSSGGNNNKKDESWVPIKNHKKSQLCIRKKHMARMFSLALRGIIYFSD